ncbi:alpha/beta hydrolase [Sphingomonas sp. R-74633]|uniref:alpha/beta fold hydrolase n=1 Tax=Sphingomonas sp. R-74633 TaxID=2751188 RepID=UPI0015D3E159|nr:alpha/beta hydrolase [Sphingomonas sp. R-74633]NYT40615.1 alpha/beta hydrolase [Sphingomonas sp. R-74633]
MIRRIAFALLATASIPTILHAPDAHAATAPAAAELIQMDHISVQVIGKGSPVILIPGLSSPRAVWDGVAPELAKTHTVYLVQVNGFGGDAPGANLGENLLPGMLADLHKLITDRKIAGAAVVGHSMGGLLALMLAQAHPADVGKALIVDALPFVGSAFFPGSTVESVQPQAAAMRDQMAGLYGKPLPEAVGQAIARQNALKPESQAIVAGWMAKADMRVAGQAMYEDLQTDLRPKLEGVKTPITVLVPWTAIRGGEAPVVSLYTREYKGAANVTVKGVAESGHFIMLDQPQAFRAALTAFLAG